MALQGTLDTFALPDVLRLLSSTHKSGQLDVTTERGHGTLWLATGELAGTVLDDATLPPVDVLFSLLRSEGGSFVFDTDQPLPDGAAPTGLEPVLGEAEQMLQEWQEIVAVVPSLHAQLTLSPELAAESVTIEQRQWRQLATIAQGSTAAELGVALGLGELSSARAVKALVEMGLVCVGAEVVPEVASEALPEPDQAALASVADEAEIEAWAGAFEPALEPAPDGEAPAPVVLTPVPDAPEALVGETAEDEASADAEELGDHTGVGEAELFGDEELVLSDDLPEPLPGSAPLDRFALFGERDVAASTATSGALPNDLGALSPDAARAVAAVMDQGGADNEPGTEDEGTNRGLLLRLLGPGRS